MRKALVVAGLLVLLAVAFFFFGAKDELDLTRTLVQGKWQSTDDAKFTREFTVDGKLIDAYVGTTPDTGNWALFTSDMPPEGFKGALEDGPIYLAIGMPETPPLYFKITKIDENNLGLVYLDRGGTLSFTRLK